MGVGGRSMECNYQVRLGWPITIAYGFRMFPWLYAYFWNNHTTNLRGASCWLDLLPPVLTQEQILIRSVGNYTHSVTSCKLRPCVEILEALIVFDILPDIARFSNCLKRNFAVNWNGTLLKIMMEWKYRTMLIVHKLSFTHYTQQLLTIHDTSHFSWETLPCVIEIGRASCRERV